MSYVTYWSACPVMTAEEVANLEDALLFHQSHDLERQVRKQAAVSAERCIASGKPWRCVFAEPLRWTGADAVLPAESTGYAEITVDVRQVRNLFLATLIAEEQIRRQLAKLDWAKLPDLSPNR